MIETDKSRKATSESQAENEKNAPLLRAQELAKAQRQEEVARKPVARKSDPILGRFGGMQESIESYGAAMDGAFGYELRPSKAVASPDSKASGGLDLLNKDSINSMLEKFQIGADDKLPSKTKRKIK